MKCDFMFGIWRQKSPMLGSMWMVKYRGNQGAKRWPWCGRYASARTKKALIHIALPFASFAHHWISLNFRFVTDLLQGFHIFPRFGADWCFVFSWVGWGKRSHVSERNLSTCLPRAKSSGIKTRAVSTVVKTGFRKDPGTLHMIFHGLNELPGQFLLGIVTPTRPVTPQQTGFFSPWVLLLECRRSWSTRTRKEVNLPCCTMGGKLNYLFLCDTLAVSISVQYRTFISHMGFAGSPFHVVRLHNMCWISMEKLKMNMRYLYPEWKTSIIAAVSLVLRHFVSFKILSAAGKLRDNLEIPLGDGTQSASSNFAGWSSCSSDMLKDIFPTFPKSDFQVEETESDRIRGIHEFWDTSWDIMRSHGICPGSRGSSGPLAEASLQVWFWVMARVFPPKRSMKN